MKEYLQESLAAVIGLAVFAACAWIWTQLFDVEFLTAFTLVAVYCLTAQQMRDARRAGHWRAPR